MAEGDPVAYNSFKKGLLDGTFDLVNDTLKLTLHTGYTPDIDSHTQRSHVSATEYSTADGYTANGKTISGGVNSQDNSNDRGKFDATDVTWTALGALTPATPSHAILWDDTAANDELIAYWELGSTATNGGDYTIQWSSNGIILVN